MASKGPALAFVTSSGIEMRGVLRRSRNADNRADSRKKTVSELVCMICLSMLSMLVFRVSLNSGVNDCRGGGGTIIVGPENLIEDRKVEGTVESLQMAGYTLYDNTIDMV